MTPGYTRYAPSGGRSQWHFVAGRTFVADVRQHARATRSSTRSGGWPSPTSRRSSRSSAHSRSSATTPSARSPPRRSRCSTTPAKPSSRPWCAVPRLSTSSRSAARAVSRRKGTQPWVLAEFRSVTGLVLGGDDHPTGPVATAARGALPLGTGVVDGELLVWSTHPHRALRGAGRRDAPLAKTPAAPVDESLRRRRSRRDRTRPAGPSDADETIIRPKRVPPAPSTSSTATIALPALDDTVRAARRPVLAQAPEAVLGFRIGSADPIDLDLPVLIGRSPRPPRVVAGVDATAHRGGVARPARSRRRTCSSSRWATPSWSPTCARRTARSCRRREGLQSRLKPGESIVVLPGARVDIGDGNIIEITPARDES